MWWSDSVPTPETENILCCWRPKLWCLRVTVDSGCRDGGSQASCFRPKQFCCIWMRGCVTGMTWDCEVGSGWFSGNDKDRNWGGKGEGGGMLGSNSHSLVVLTDTFQLSGVKSFLPMYGTAPPPLPPRWNETRTKWDEGEKWTKQDNLFRSRAHGCHSTKYCLKAPFITYLSWLKPLFLVWL